MAQTAKIIDFQEQRRLREVARPIADNPFARMMPMPGITWVPVFMMPVMVLGSIQG